MTFYIPSLAACVQAARQAFRAYLPGTDAWLWPNNIGPSAKVIGGSAWEIFNRLDAVQRAKFALTAEGPDLDMHGSEIGLTRKGAKPAAGNIVVTTQAAITAGPGAQLERADGTIVAATVGGATSGSGTLTLATVANVAALAGNSQPGTAFTMISGFSGPGAGTATAVADSSGLTGGLDVEADGLPFTADLGTFRGRILFRKRNPIQGGAPSDYVTWALEVSGVTRVFVERYYAGAGTVRVFPIFDDLFGATGGIADSAHIALVANALAVVQPAAAQVTVVAPTAQPINVSALGTLQPNTTTVQNAVLAELADTFRRMGRVSGNDPANSGILAAMPYLAAPFSFSTSWIEQAVANATGEQRAIISAPASGSDAAISAACLPVLGTVT
jgi:uncharacterized phage protein gp47/JayE